MIEPSFTICQSMDESHEDNSEELSTRVCLMYDCCYVK